MQYIADLEVHSRFSRAVSSQMTVPNIAKWAAIKGIDVVGTGDFTHPIWFRELKVNLEEAEPGLHRLRDGSEGGGGKVRFLVTGEVSSIFSQGGRGYRIHTLLFAPNLEDAEKINKALSDRGANLISDGRPIMGLSVKEIADTVLSCSPETLIIPAHVWTPWFGYYGANGGFDSLEEGFGQFAKYIYAIETGMSSDPAMNWGIRELEGRSIVSFGDAHSLTKLGREATVFEIPEGQLSYEAIRQAIVADRSTGPAPGFPPASARSQAAARVSGSLPPVSPVSPGPSIAYTIEFYPEEGKYHYTGHRNCGVKHSSQQTNKLGATCPVCGKKLTIGVMHRVEELARQKSEILNPKFETDEYRVRWVVHPEDNRPPYVTLVPLLEILSESLGVGVASQKVVSEYERLTTVLGTEFKILLQTKVEELERAGGPIFREAVEKVRAGDIFIDPGFDGVFGKVKIWGAEEEKAGYEQTSLF